MKLPETVQARFEKLKAMQQNGNHQIPALPSVENVCTCRNCGTHFSGLYCPACGQSAKTERLTFRESFDQIIGVFVDFDRGFLHTCLELFYRPGYMIRDYIKGHRIEYVKPIKLLFLLGTIIIAFRFLLFQTSASDINLLDGMEGIDNEAKPFLQFLQKTFQWLFSNVSVVYLLMTILMVFPIKVCFRNTPFSKELNMAEHFFAITYVVCQLLIWKILTIPYDRLFTNQIDTTLDFGLPFLLLLSWDFSQLFGIRFIRSVKLTILTWAMSLFLLILSVLIFVCIVILLYPELRNS